VVADLAVLLLVLAAPELQILAVAVAVLEILLEIMQAVTAAPVLLS
jgi:hypothetical protein